MIDWYQQLIKDGTLLPDEAQAAAVHALHDFAAALAAAPAGGEDWKDKLQQWIGGGTPTPQQHGVYLHGGVGRGKSFLMDGFYLQLPLQKKLRVHFHQFMRRLHADMKANENRHDPLVHVARNIAEKYDLICFDEFHVSDITDAMLLGRLLDILFAAGVRFVMTSNYPPAGLYPNGLARERFLPAIALLEEKLQLVALDGVHDYRRHSFADQPVYFAPWTDTRQQQLMQTAFDRLACSIYLQNNIKLGGRRLLAVARSSDCIWFDFSILCAEARAKADYLQLAERFATIFLSAVPLLDNDDLSDAARRFTWLVDIAYDARVQLVLGAEATLDKLYGGRDGGESGRTLSRLIEMQSSAYSGSMQPERVSA